MSNCISIEYCAKKRVPFLKTFIFGEIAQTLAKAFGLSLTVTEEAEKAFDHLLEKKGLVIANIQRDRLQDDWIGVFSDSAHYVVLAGIEEQTLRIWDSMYYPGRYDVPGRKGKVDVIKNEAYTNCENIRQDCKDWPFFLFSVL